MPPSTADSGSYQYLLNGEVTGIREHWSRQALAGGDYQLNSGRSAPGIDIEVQARQRDKEITRFEVQWQSSQGVSVEAQYSLSDGYLSVRRRQGSDAFEDQLLDLRDESIALLSPLMRIYTGPVIARLLQAGGQGAVVVPAIGDPSDHKGLLQPHIGRRQARLLQAAELSSDGVAQPCRLCEYSGDQYGPGARFWLSRDDLLLRYEWQQSAQLFWQVNLQLD